MERFEIKHVVLGGIMFIVIYTLTYGLLWIAQLLEFVTKAPK